MWQLSSPPFSNLMQRYIRSKGRESKIDQQALFIDESAAFRQILCKISLKN